MRCPCLLSLALILTLFAPVTAVAQKTPRAGDRISSRGDLTLREAPPEGFFGLRGEKIGTVIPSEEFLVLDRREVPSISGGQEWLQIESSDGVKKGWIYSGPSGSATSNVTRIDK